MTPAKHPTRSFLMLQPRPTKVRLVLQTGETRTIDIGSRPIWKRIAETIDTLGPTTIEAFDASDKLLRARDPERAAEQGEVAPGADLEEDDPTLPRDSDELLTTVARLIADAHRVSGERAFQFVECAFSRMVDIVNSQTKRMDSMERVVEGIHKTWRRAYEASLDGDGDEQPSTLQQMLGAFLAAQGPGGVAQIAQAQALKPNGAAPHKG
jgi:hypothetical protein